jgi:uncharacterized membrane protein YcaP (DUF421 family)
MFFDRAYDVIRVLVVGSLSYVALVAVLRVSGKRTLAKMNAFDLVVTVSLGSTLATIALSSDVALVEGIAAFVVLCSAQFVVARSAVRWRKAESAVKSRPVLLVEDGEMLVEAVAAERLTESEVLQAIRSSGSGGLAQVAAVVLETDGSLSVITTSAAGDRGALRDVERRRARNRG